jgi:hypothetical protein
MGEQRVQFVGSVVFSDSMSVTLDDKFFVLIIIIIIILNHFFPMTLGGYFEKQPFCGGKFLTQ